MLMNRAGVGVLMIGGLLIGWASRPADAAPPSDASIQQLLTVMDSHRLVDSMKAQVDANVNSALEAAARSTFHGENVTPEAAAVLERMRARMLAVAEDSISWDTMLPIFLRTYRASFTQEELDGMTAFYRTPAGQALIRKMPLVMQNVMGEVQSMMAPMQQKMQAIQQDTLRDLKSLPAATAPGAPEASPR